MDYSKKSIMEIVESKLSPTPTIAKRGDGFYGGASICGVSTDVMASIADGEGQAVKSVAEPARKYNRVIEKRKRRKIENGRYGKD